MWEYKKELLQKLLEECNEVINAANKEETLEEIADTSPICSTIVARAIGIMVIAAVTNKEVSGFLKIANTVFSATIGNPIHCASFTAVKSTWPVTAATTYDQN